MSTSTKTPADSVKTYFNFDDGTMHIAFDLDSKPFTFQVSTDKDVRLPKSVLERVERTWLTSPRTLKKRFRESALDEVPPDEIGVTHRTRHGCPSYEGLSKALDKTTRQLIQSYERSDNYVEHRAMVESARALLAYAKERQSHLLSETNAWIVEDLKEVKEWIDDVTQRKKSRLAKTQGGEGGNEVGRGEEQGNERDKVEQMKTDGFGLSEEFGKALCMDSAAVIADSMMSLDMMVATADAIIYTRETLREHLGPSGPYGIARAMDEEAAKSQQRYKDLEKLVLSLYEDEEEKKMVHQLGKEMGVPLTEGEEEPQWGETLAEMRAALGMKNTADDDAAWARRAAGEEASDEAEETEEAEEVKAAEESSEAEEAVAGDEAEEGDETDSHGETTQGKGKGMAEPAKLVASESAEVDQPTEATELQIYNALLDRAGALQLQEQEDGGPKAGTAYHAKNWRRKFEGVASIFKVAAERWDDGAGWAEEVSVAEIEEMYKQYE